MTLFYFVYIVKHRCLFVSMGNIGKSASRD
ncbi:hypothetical protein IGG_06863, partial [Bacillus cereus HuB13-1]